MSQSQVCWKRPKAGAGFHASLSGAGGILEAIRHFGFLGTAGLDAEARDILEPGKADLVMVYHRLPYEEVVEDGVMIRRRPASPNGIIPTLLSFFADGKAGSWVAWSVHDNKQGKFETHTEVRLVVIQSWWQRGFL
ncbi:hypothetical protein IMCC21906_00001 [Spongiibacter sp. IMCC21906]|uniref:hypothetical protein n=1 Tax=Spongiibacter sp. IMCC21906 TaxID=1620392 RepID=UPI00062DF0D3|nr:hypothetical protein [Spongiibacter sp. IMCC21906]AKH67697.1 hypothetical protein IMCC21906_00001 [Spongiibacter sp. IMCC21906]